MQNSSDESRGWIPFQWVGAAIVGTGLIFFIFDILRKTIFLGASWNYNYPQRRLVYDPLLTLFLFGTAVLLILFVRLGLQTRRRYFLSILFVSGVLLPVLALFSMPLYAADVLNPARDGFYQAGVVAIEHGPIEYFSIFHSIGPVSGKIPHAEAAQTTASILRTLDILPWNEQMAEYAVMIPEQKHGPIPILLVAPFIYIHSLGMQFGLLGSYLLTATLPVMAYFVYRLHFSERYSRIGALFILFVPAFHLYQHSIVPYDMITGLFLTGSLYYFLYAIKYDSLQSLVLSGILFSLAFLSKISALTIVLAYVPILLLRSDNVGKSVEKFGAFALGTSIVPVGLLFIGYNFVIQYLFTFARLMNSDPAQGAGAYLQNSLLSYLGPIYNLRLLGPSVLLFAILFVSSVTYHTLRTHNISKGRQIIALCLVLPLIPFLFLLSAPLLSRHLIPMVVLVVFLGLEGVQMVNCRDGCIRLVQTALLANLLVMIASL